MVNGVTDTYSYLGTSETVTRIATAGGTTLDSIVSPAGDRLGVKAGSTLNYLVPDLHGNVAGSLDESEASVVHAIRYDAWGETIGSGSAGGSSVGSGAWKYQGRLDVSPAGLSTPLYDMSARFYAPGIAAFTSLDSVMGTAQNPLSMNRFLYAHANPATLIDPTGHKALSAEGSLTGWQSQTKINTSDNLRRKYENETARYYSNAGKRSQAGTVRHQQRKASLRIQHITSTGVEDHREVHQYKATRAVETARARATRASRAGGGIDWGGIVHTALDVGGMVPVLGAAPDLINAGYYGLEGDFVNAGMAGFAAIPLIGDALGGTKLAVKYGDDVIGAGLHLGDELTGGGFKLLDDAAAGGTKVCSFTPDTRVATPDGDIRISDIDVGDRVLARSEQTGTTSVRAVSAVLRHADEVTGSVVVDGEAIETTPEHPFFSLDRGFVPAAELLVGELVATASGVPGEVDSITWDGGPAEMWNLTVAVDHTFFVGEGRVWVHNACPGSGGPDFIVDGGGQAFPVPKGANGPRPADSGKGIQFNGGSATPGLDSRVTDIRVMDPVTTGTHTYPNGYVSYSNVSGQVVDPLTGRTLGEMDPMWHIPIKQR